MINKEAGGSITLVERVRNRRGQWFFLFGANKK
jgi:hypothetical protein